MFDAKKLLDQFLGSQVPGTSGSVGGMAGQVTDLAKKNPLATGAIAAAVLGTKTGRKLAGNAVKVGGIAAIAGLGYLAYKNFKSGGAAADQAAPAENAPQAPLTLPAPPADSPFNPQSAAMSNSFVLVLLQAMIAAANADGHIDAAERQQILEKISLSDLDKDAEAFLEKELAQPMTIEQLTAQNWTEEQKVEIYTVSRLTVDLDSRVERRYLDELATRLALPDALVDQIDATVARV